MYSALLDPLRTKQRRKRLQRRGKLRTGTRKLVSGAALDLLYCSRAHLSVVLTVVLIRRVFFNNVNQ
jgi:hypothetical protein